MSACVDVLLVSEDARIAKIPLLGSGLCTHFVSAGFPAFARRLCNDGVSGRDSAISCWKALVTLACAFILCVLRITALAGTGMLPGTKYAMATLWALVPSILINVYITGLNQVLLAWLEALQGRLYAPIGRSFTASGSRVSASLYCVASHERRLLDRGPRSRCERM